MRPVRRFAAVLFLILSLAAMASAQAIQEGLPPLPQDTGTAGLVQAIRHLGNTGRLLHTTAHPDDEDGGLLTLLSRGDGVHVELLTLNRGEGGQNRTGSELFDELGVLRTLELTGADHYYDVHQRFTRVTDFGFSKTAEETLQKWGTDLPLSDMVRVIRTFRPDVIVSRFQGNSNDGHGNHEAAGILTKEAFRAAADPNKFPEQIKEGLLPWQAKKLYIGTGFRENPDYTVKVETTQNSPQLGVSYQQFAIDGLRHQTSQGAGEFRFPAGPRFARYKLVDSVLPKTLDAEGHERDFFEGIDTSISGLVKRLGPESHRSERLPGLFADLQSRIQTAAAAAEKDPQAAAKALSEADKILTSLEKEMSDAGLNKVALNDVDAHLPTHAAIEHAINLAEGVSLEARLDAPATPSAELIVPGQQFTAKLQLHAPAGARMQRAAILAPDGWTITELPNANATPLERRFTVKVSAAAQYTKPYFHRDDPEVDPIYKIDNPADLTMPLTPRPLRAEIAYELNGITSKVTQLVEADSVLDGGTRPAPLAVAPEASVLFSDPTRVVRVGQTQPVEINVRIRSIVPDLRDGVLSLSAGSGWHVEPVSQPVTIEGKGTERNYKFFLFPNADREMRFQIHAKLSLNGHDYDQGFTTVSRPDLGTAYYYQPAMQKVSVVRLELPQSYEVGYVMGAGEDIPSVLRQAGLSVHMISPEELASGDLSRYNAIILGIRAYDVNENVRKNNARLLSFVEKGGTLVVQYNSGTSEFNGGNYTPYPAELGRGRVSVEEAPVEILDPKDFIFNDPNDIVPADFNGWIQERGLYFMSTWGGKFIPLLASHDPGEPPLQGGLLRASYGKGTYVYTGYAFFRQLPYGVPGALRLFVNILSAHQ
ncbi:MAG TPA: PIG-L family deacetylase [Terriglobales bacterium]|nr:PIG-L family deacetylase [Terriglobales bacterium]